MLGHRRTSSKQSRLGNATQIRPLKNHARGDGSLYGLGWSAAPPRTIHIAEMNETKDGVGYKSMSSGTA